MQLGENMKKTKEKHTLECAYEQPTMCTHKKHNSMCAYAGQSVRTHKWKISKCAYAPIPVRTHWSHHVTHLKEIDGAISGPPEPSFGPSEAD